MLLVLGLKINVSLKVVLHGQPKPFERNVRIYISNFELSMKILSNADMELF
jgi:hypothetical protein